MKRLYTVGDNYSLVDVGADNVAHGIRIEITTVKGNLVGGKIIASQGPTGYSVGNYAHFSTDTLDELGYPL